MTATLNKNKSMILGFIAIVILLFSLFSNPVIASASSSSQANYNDPNKVTVEIHSGPSGGLVISGGGFTSGGSADAWTAFLNKYKGFITGVAGIGAITMIVLFIIQFIKLGASAGNPQARSQALVGVLWTGIAAAGLGAVTLIVGFFYNAI